MTYDQWKTRAPDDEPPYPDYESAQEEFEWYNEWRYFYSIGDRRAEDEAYWRDLIA